MRWLTNTYDPRRDDAMFHVCRNIDQSQYEAWLEHQKWLRGKIISLPKATPWHTTEQLQEIGMVGVYEGTIKIVLPDSAEMRQALAELEHYGLIYRR